MSPDQPSPKGGGGSTLPKAAQDSCDRKKAASASTTDEGPTGRAAKKARKEGPTIGLGLTDSAMEDSAPAAQQHGDERMDDAPSEQLEDASKQEDLDDLHASRNLASNLQKLEQELKQLDSQYPDIAALCQIIHRVPWFPRQMKMDIKALSESGIQVDRANFVELCRKRGLEKVLDFNEKNCEAIAIFERDSMGASYINRCNQAVSAMKRDVEMAACLLGLLSIMSEKEKTTEGVIGKGTEDYIAQCINRKDDSPGTPAIFNQKEKLLSKTKEAALDISEFLCVSELAAATQDASISSSYGRLQEFAPNWPPEDDFPPLVAAETSAVQPQFHRLLKRLGKILSEQPPTDLLSPAKSTTRREVRFPGSGNCCVSTKL